MVEDTTASRFEIERIMYIQVVSSIKEILAVDSYREKMTDSGIFEHTKNIEVECLEIVSMTNTKGSMEREMR